MGVLSTDKSFTVNDEASDPWNVPVSSNYMFYVTGDLGGGHIAFETSPDNGTNWFTVDTLNSAGRLIRYLVNGERVRITVCNTTNPGQGDDGPLVAGIRQ